MEPKQRHIELQNSWTLTRIDFGEGDHHELYFRHGELKLAVVSPKPPLGENRVIVLPVGVNTGRPAPTGGGTGERPPLVGLDTEDL